MEEKEKKEEIGRLVERYLNNEATPGECARIDHWLEQDDELGQWLAQRIEKQSPAMPLYRRHRRVIFWWAVAATLVAVATSLFVVLSRPDNSYSDQSVAVHTNAGERSAITLPDGTQLTLNHLSEIRYNYNPQTGYRMLTLRGEAMFDVHTDKKHPFVVSCGGLDIECLGTSFNVKGYADEEAVSVVLLDGKIRVHSDEGYSEMQPGDKVNYDRFSRRIETSRVEAADYTGWAQGGYRFNNEPLEVILRSISRQYDVKINITTPSLNGVRLSGSIEGKNLDETLNIISSAAGAHHKLLPDSTISIFK